MPPSCYCCAYLVWLQEQPSHCYFHDPEAATISTSNLFFNSWIVPNKIIIIHSFGGKRCDKYFQIHDSNTMKIAIVWNRKCYIYACKFQSAVEEMPILCQKKLVNIILLTMLLFSCLAERLPLIVWRICPDEVQTLLQENGKVC